MGYTHYWTVDPASPAYLAVWPLISVNARRLAEYAAEFYGVSLAGPDGAGDPVFSGGRVAFNTAGPAESDAFVLDTAVPDHASHDPLERDEARRYARLGVVERFCKTNRHSHDLVVAAVLLRMRQWATDAFVLRSDGDWDAEWVAARLLVAEVFPGPVNQPSPLAAPGTMPACTSRRRCELCTTGAAARMGGRLCLAAPSSAGSSAGSKGVSS